MRSCGSTTTAVPVSAVKDGGFGTYLLIKNIKHKKSHPFYCLKIIISMLKKVKEKRLNSSVKSLFTIDSSPN